MDESGNRLPTELGRAKASTKSQTNLLPILLATLLMSVLMLLYELLKQTLFPHIRIWQSHVATIVFTSLITAVIAWVVLRANQRAKVAILRHELEFEETLGRERNLLRTLIDNLPDCVYAKDAAGRKTLANPADLKNYRCQTAAEAIGKSDFDLFPRDIAEKFWADDQKVIQGQPVINREEYFFNEAGEKRWLLTSKLPLRDQTGKIAGLVGIGRDITERKQAEEAVANERALLRTLVDHLPLAVYVKDLTGRKTLANSMELSYAGVSSESEILGKSDSDLYPREVAATYRADDQKMFDSGQAIINREGSFTKADGSILWFLHSKIPLRDAAGNVAGLIGINVDITERKRTEEKIREQAALLDVATDAIWVLDSNERISYWNKGAERIYGWSAAEAIGKNPVDLLFKGIMTPQLRECIKIVNERGEWTGELEEFTRDGKTIIVQGRSNVIRDEQGRRKSLLIISADITEKKKLETQIFRSQRMESLGTLAGGIAHDLNNVLAPLLISIEVLKEKITDADGEKLLDSLEANVQRGADLVKQVLAFGRGVEGERIAVNPRHIAREIKQIVLETFPKSVEHEFHSPADLWTITGDPTQLHQVLLNLCINARDAMPTGGKLSIHMENVMFDEISARTNLEAKPGPYVCIKVADTGTGIPKEIRDRIFDPFFTTKAPGKGTGLGLSTTLAIVKSHGGFIHCYSEVGKGSTFIIYLPANIGPIAAENPVVEKSRLPRGHEELVLLVDDEEPIRQMAQKTLERYGYRVLLAADGAEAVSLYKARQNEIDVVVTDMIMPVMDGLDTIMTLKTVNPSVKIIGSSGLASHNGMTKARDAGVRHLLSKPYTAETMLNTLHDVLNAV